MPAYMNVYGRANRRREDTGTRACRRNKQQKDHQETWSVQIMKKKTVGIRKETLAHMHRHTKSPVLPYQRQQKCREEPPLARLCKVFEVLCDEHHMNSRGSSPPDSCDGIPHVGGLPSQDADCHHKMRTAITSISHPKMRDVITLAERVAHARGHQHMLGFSA